ncbi:MAG: hypothetical protein MZV63_55345 [Marinilabiliales bacterium]|nr:hypothetical protein [Marinilabiliales bacterium]
MRLADRENTYYSSKHELQAHSPWLPVNERAGILRITRVCNASTPWFSGQPSTEGRAMMKIFLNSTKG